MNKTPSHPLRPAWYEPLAKALGLQPDSTAEQVLKKADTVANTLAPNTRRLWKWILTLEGVAVVLLDDASEAAGHLGGLSLGGHGW